MQRTCCVSKNINGLESTFDWKRAETDARAYLQKGANKRIKKLLAYFQDQSTKPFTVLDIGCGVGGAHFELWKNGLALDVVGLEASSSYPHEDWWVRVFYKLSNFMRELKKSEFFTYVHSHANVHEVGIQNGLFPVHATHSGDWQITIFARQE